MAKQRKPAVDFLVYFVIRILVCVLQAISLQQALRFADCLAWLAHRIDRRHRQVALENLRHAFGDSMTASQREATVRATYRHFCRLLMEIVQLPRRLHPTTWRRHVELPHARVLLDALLSGRPLLFATGHYGNWEMGGYVLGLFGFHTYAVARPLDNPYLDRFLRNFRERTGQKLLAKKGDFDLMQGILAEGGAIATLADQDAGQRGLFVEFFGRPASTHKAVALMAIEHEVLIVVTLTRRVGWPMRYVVEVEDVIDPKDYADNPNAVREITQRYTSALERGIRKSPEQYFWLHRRWKHQPQERKRVKKAVA